MPTPTTRPFGEGLLSRRDALKVLGGGLIVFLLSPGTAHAEQLPNGYLRIAADGLITLYTHKTELGQGIVTALAQIAAEELDAPLDSMRVVTGDTVLCAQYSDQETWGSLTVSDFGPLLRNAAARARALLIKVAAEQLGLPEERLITRDAFVIDRENQAVRLSYAVLAGSESLNRPLGVVTQKDPAKYTLSGRPVSRIDGIDKVTGKALYASDIRLPEMLYARIVRPPVHGATFLAPPNTSAAEQIPGVRVVRVGTSMVAVLHSQPDLAERALGLVTAQFTQPASGPTDQTIHDHILAHPPDVYDTWIGGNLTLGRSEAVLTREQSYFTPFLAHAPMETHSAVASYADGSVKVWTSTQGPFQTRSSVAAALGLPSSKVHVITTYVGGAFGGKAYNNRQAVEAAQLSKAVGKPVNVTWTREEEFFYDSFQPPCIVTIQAGLNASGKLCLWDSKSYMTGNYHQASGGPYTVANHRTRFYGHWYNPENTRVFNLPFPVGPWRAPGNNAATFARESHLDALASAAKMDPVEFRLRHLKNARARTVLTRAAEAFGWTTSKAPTGRGMGVACGEYNDVFVAVMVELSVDVTTGRIQVARMLSAQDNGRVINPDGVRQQMEGCLVMGLGYALSEELHFRAPAITDLNFNQYSLPRFSGLPRLETLIVANDSLAPKGSGEPSIVAVGGAVANALFDATGVQPNRLPLTPSRVLALLREAPPPDLNPPEYSADQVRLSWLPRPGLKLQRAANLGDPEWKDIAITEGQSQITLPATDRWAFFRLVKP